MADGGFMVFDGTQLGSLSWTLPESNAAVLTGAEVLDFADSKVSASLFGLSLPQNLKTTALKHAVVDPQDHNVFRQKKLDKDQASKIVANYINAITDELKDDPLVVSILDGNSLRLFLEDEDDFAMIAENLFTDLDTEDKGKISKSKVRMALAHMGVGMGVPPISEFPLLNDILKKHRAEGEEEVGQAQFAQLLQPVLQELADALAEKHVVYVQNIKIVNGSKLRKLLTEDEELNNVIRNVMQEQQNNKDDLGAADIIRGFLEKHWKELGLPPSEANEAVVLLYDAVFTHVESAKSGLKNEDDFREFVKEVLEKFAEQLEANPVYYEHDH